MEKQKDKMWFSHHAKSSAAVVSIGIHVLLLVIALSFVAVTVIKKDEKNFKAKQVVRPKMPIKRLQVPVNVKKKAPKPKLRKRIVVKPNINKSMPDIKMPEVSGLKGGLGATGGLGGSAGVGFSMPEIKIFGVKSKGEKVFIALDASAYILRDHMGGILSYRLIKEEVARVISRLGSTALFNVAVFDVGDARMLFPKMVPATAANKARVSQWLEPLNEFVDGRSGRAYGIGTLDPQEGTPIRGDYLQGDLKKLDASPPKRGREWYAPMGAAMELQADSVFLLSGTWGMFRWASGGAAEWSPSNKRKWEEKVREGWALVATENEQRAARGEPPQVISNDPELIITYWGRPFYDKIMRPEPEWHDYEGRDVAQSLYLCRQDYAPKTSKTVLKKKRDFSLNVVLFTPKDTPDVEGHRRFKELSGALGGQCRSIRGLEAIKSSVSSK